MTASGNDTKEALGEDSEREVQEVQDGSSSDDHTDSSTEGSHESEEEETGIDRVETKDGHRLSEYEILRLERIKRNREYLASLGLEQAKPHTESAHRRKRKKLAPHLSRRRSSLSRSSKQGISYIEKPAKEAIQTTVSDSQTAITESPSNAQSASKVPRATMDRAIYIEFKRIESETRQALKTAERDLKNADVEYRHAKKSAEVHRRKEMKRLEAQQRIQEAEEERRCLGCTAKELLLEIDRRTPEIAYVIRAYEDKLVAQANIARWAEQQEETNKKMQMIDAMDRLPRSLKAAIRNLDLLLLERSPMDPPPPRRGNRKRKSSDEPICESSQDNKDPKRARETAQNEDGLSGIVATIATKALSSAATCENEKTSTLGSDLVQSEPVDSRVEGDSSSLTTKRKRDVTPRNVGGWISPKFSREIDRSWLEGDSHDANFELPRYVPQIGDTVLYYPAGHRAFLRSHPDDLGKKTRNKLRIPLWARAKSEREKILKAAADAGVTLNQSPEASSISSTWWNDEWLSSFDGCFENFPLLCRVERTHAEFPADPNAAHKVVSKNGEGGIVQVLWTLSGHNSSLKKQQRKTKSPLCLAVTLRPLTSLLPPKSGATDGGSSDDKVLSVPPNFTVVTFPSQESPYIIPFGWAYQCFHSLSPGMSVRLRSEVGWRGTVKWFNMVHGDYGTSCLEDKVAFIDRLLVALNNGPESFEKTVGKATSLAIPMDDVRIVIERLKSVASESSVDPSSISPTQGPPALATIIRSTLPIWKGIFLEGSDGRRFSVCAWDVVFDDIEVMHDPERSAAFQISSSLLVNGSGCCLDEPLRAKLECSLEDFINDTPDSMIFRPLLSDTDAPSYSCAVPITMSFDRILRRLKCNRDTNGLCYYRSTEALLNDLSTIADNCLLYNSPESFVVEKASEMIPAIKRIISSVALSHLKSKKASEKADDDRRAAILLLCNSSPLIQTEQLNENQSSGNIASRRRIASTAGLRQPPFKAELTRSWIQIMHPDNSWTHERKNSSVSVQTTAGPLLKNNPPHGYDTLTDQVECDVTIGTVTNGWLPQSGDMVLYSRLLHADFVKGHYSSLATEHCSLPQFSAESQAIQTKPSGELSAIEASELSNQLQNKWLAGEVISVRAVFPRSASIADDDSVNTFDQPSPLLALSIAFHYSWAGSKNVHTIYWRPCVICDKPSSVKVKGTSIAFRRSFEMNANDGERAHYFRERCRTCNVPLEDSFVRPAWIPLRESTLSEEKVATHKVLLPDAIPNERILSPPTGLTEDEISAIDHCLNTLKCRCLDGIEPDFVDPKLCMESIKRGWRPTVKTVRNVPTFERLLEKGISNAVEFCEQDIVRTRGIEKVDERMLAALADFHYLPPWTSTLALTQENRTKTDRDGIIKSIASYEAVSPCPNLCLELIQIRLRLGYYRQKAALVYDIQEAYVASVLAALYEPASRKKFPLSIRRIAKSLATGHLSLQDKCKIASPNNGGTAGTTKLHESGDDEVSWLQRVHRVRQLHGMALVCAVDTVCVERVFGSLSRRKGRMITHQHAPNFEKERLQKEARHKLDCILSSLRRDPCANLLPSSSRDPQAKVKILPIIGSEDEGQCLAVPSRSEGEGVQSQYAKMTTDGVDMSRPMEFGPKEFDANPGLVPIFFGRPGRMNACARCRAHGRSMLSCRVHKNHSNLDFDWIQTFKGSGGLNGLLYSIRTGELLPAPEALPRLETAIDPKAENNTVKSGSDVDEMKNEMGQSPQTMVPVTKPSPLDSMAERDTVPDPLFMLEQAKIAMRLATSLVDKARDAAESPPRLSEEFIRTHFPIDPADGHYNYCIICGLSGDVMCCEGCSNVAHAQCVKLVEIPDDDWYCWKCTSRTLMNSNISPSLDKATDAVSKPKGTAVPTLENDGGRHVVMNSLVTKSESEELTDILSKLKAFRQNASSQGTGRKMDGEMSSNSKISNEASTQMEMDKTVTFTVDSDSAGTVVKRRGRPQGRLTTETDKSVTPTADSESAGAVVRRRGRPPGHLTTETEKAVTSTVDSDSAKAVVKRRGRPPGRLPKTAAASKILQPDRRNNASKFNHARGKQVISVEEVPLMQTARAVGTCKKRGRPRKLAKEG